MKTDVVLCMPPISNDEAINEPYIPAGVAAIQGAITNAGYSSIIYDHGIDLAYKHHNGIYSDSEFQTIEKSLYFDSKTIPNINDDSLTMKLMRSNVDELLSHDPKWVMFGTVFDTSNIAIKLLSKEIKRRRPDIKIVVGGIGVTQFIDYFTVLRHEKIIDYTIMGPGEFTVIELLKNNLTCPGINSNPPVNTRDMDASPYSGFEGLQMDRYVSSFFGQYPEYTLTASEGCVYKCRYCNISHHWPKFIWRSPKRIADEMRYIVKKYGAKRFRFSDSLLNASMPKFRELMKEIILVQNELPIEDRFNWASQFVVKARSKFVDEDFDLVAKAGGDMLMPGFESGSEKVRKDMNVPSSNKDFEYFCQQCQRTGIRILNSNIVGYVTETEKEFQESLDFYTNLKQYKDVFTVRAGTTMLLVIGSEMQKDPAKFNIEFIDIPDVGSKDSTIGTNWICTTNKENTLITRLQRSIRLMYHFKVCGYTEIHHRHYFALARDFYFRATGRIGQLESIASKLDLSKMMLLVNKDIENGIK